MRLIDADELLKHKGNCYDAEGHLLYAVGTGDIMAAKTIDPVKHGKWNICEGGHEPPDYMDAAVMECGVCGWITEYYGGLEEEWNYCPNCGSKNGGEG